LRYQVNIQARISLRHAPAADAQAIVERLRDESRVKPDTGVRIGF
jgi:hypothetical protein